MTYYVRINVPEGVDVDNTSGSKDYWLFSTIVIF